MELNLNDLDPETAEQMREALEYHPLGDQPTERELELGEAVARMIAERNPPPRDDETTGGSP